MYQKFSYKNKFQNDPYTYSLWFLIGRSTEQTKKPSNLELISRKGYLTLNALDILAQEAVAIMLTFGADKLLITNIAV